MLSAYNIAPLNKQQVTGTRDIRFAVDLTQKQSYSLAKFFLEYVVIRSSTKITAGDVTNKDLYHDLSLFDAAMTQSPANIDTNFFF